MTTVIQIFPIYFATVAAAELAPPVATARFALATTLALAIVAVAAPVLGAIADYAGAKKKLLAGFLALGVCAVAGLYFVERGDWQLGAALFVLGNIGVTASFVFYDSLLPHIARDDEVDRLSTAGYALGYLGGGLLMAFNLLWIAFPERFGFADDASATRFSFLSAAIWWLGFSIPLFRRVPEPPRGLEAGERPGQGLLLTGFRRLGQTLRELRGYRNAFLFLLAFMIYNDGIQTIIRMAAIYGTELGFERNALIGSILLVQFVGVPFAFLFGALAGRLGTRRMIAIGLAVYALISVLGYRMTTVWHFFVLALLVGMVQGGTQALSRSLFATMIPRHKSTEFFAFFGVFEKFAGIFGPALFAALVTATGTSRNAILAVITFFAVGGALLAKVDVAEGQRAAREADARAGRGSDVNRVADAAMLESAENGG
jgi:UMF1 family MFS transporter